MVGLHDQLRSNQTTFWTLGELRGGTLRDGTGFTGTSSLSSANIIIQDLRESATGISSWGGLYAPIFQVNNQQHDPHNDKVDGRHAGNQVENPSRDKVVQDNDNQQKSRRKVQGNVWHAVSAQFG